MRAGSVVLTLAIAGCGARERPDTLKHRSRQTDAGSLDGGAFTIEPPKPPGADAALCGNVVVPLEFERPNLYFVVDRSGSMSEVMPGAAHTRYLSAQTAIGTAISLVGHRVNYGAATFPGDGGVLGCEAGEEIFATQPGEPHSTLDSGLYGPLLFSLIQRLARRNPDGGTPISSTLEALRPTLTSLPGETFVFLITDGAPNCNAGIRCGVDACVPNLEGWELTPGVVCDDTINCCDSSLVEYGELRCLDAPGTVDAVSNLALAGIKTFVIGIPGSQVYANVLDQAAVAGGTARATSPLYYRVDDDQALAETLSQIGEELAFTCDITLATPPELPSLVNVFFDEEVVYFDESDGWQWHDERTVRLVGSACSRALSGTIGQVRVVAGCPVTPP